MDNLFTELENEAKMAVAPLAVRMRPRTLDELKGQQEAVGEGSWLHAAIAADTLSSIILFGPAGTGKTSIAHIIAETTRAIFVEVSAIGGTVSDLRREIAAAEKRLYATGRRTILFVDEIHRFNRSQQDALLHAVENRTVVLIGATTENPFFEVNSALISRSRVVELHSLSDDDIRQVLDAALADERGLKGEFDLLPDAAEAIVTLSGGDARGALTTLELASGLARQAVEDGAAKTPDGRIPITADMVQLATPHRVLPYDKNKDMHYDIISAFIKSMRGSDPDAALYWMARMLDGGEDPKFIARRIYILASEDIGNADPQALLIAEAAFRAVEVIGLPECRINLAQAVIYMALAPKSNACESAIDAALSEVRHGPKRDVPSYLRDRHRPGAENYGRYLYPHDYPGHWVDQRYLPDGLEKGCFYQPGESGWEAYRVDATSRDRKRPNQ
ncbi:Replication-associated recombination protein A [Slackia heliotrinireducens]|uniref:Recombination protein MgsA n=1 Tax=Slackia heliotrinireducens (strain ATCC 29202 / DSM 20476 / NCTC 11029 / RHS 1) TaxID=471855 RepID=C7N4J8_SLAHD|nr:replication-associated recombination protein A [Slackia heliotrinireducens]ACV21833.1 Recombination protein MgsA [Slackia heliotrinireducens DSM 20476]VEG99562.1 Replication-associated recombination protein A [Slackia heliotrinireducens]